MEDSNGTGWNFRPWDFPMLGLMWGRLEELLADDEWHSWTGEVKDLMAAGDATEATARDLLYRGIRERHLCFKGRWARGKDSRMVAQPRGGMFRAEDEEVEEWMG